MTNSIPFSRGRKPTALTGVCLALFLLTGAAFSSASAGEVAPLPRTHAHNDYEHARPLLDALSHGFCSIEADIYLIDGKLLVAHNRSDTRPDRTLQALYLDPLRKRIKENRGWVYSKPQQVILLIDIKTGAEETYKVLGEVLKQYEDILQSFPRMDASRKPVAAILSGNRPTSTVAKELNRLVAIDGRPEDLKNGSSPELIPLVSESWTSLFKWRGEGAMEQAEESKLRGLVGQAHAQGRQIRFWATADKPVMWEKLHEVGADLINADDLAGLESFLRVRQGTSTR